MPARRPAPGELEPIETASRDELRRCSSSACGGRCATPTTTCRIYRAQVRRGRGVHPATSARSPTSRRFPFTTKDDLREHYPFGMFAVPREQVRARARLLRHHRQADRRRLHRATTSTIWAKLMARSIRAAGGRPGDIVHVAYGYGLFTGGLGAHYGAETAGLHGDSDVRRHDRAAGAARSSISSPTSSW